MPHICKGKVIFYKNMNLLKFVLHILFKIKIQYNINKIYNNNNKKIYYLIFTYLKIIFKYKTITNIKYVFLHPI